MLSKFDGKRLVADPSTAFDGDVIREFPYRQARKAKRGGSDEHHKRIPTSMFLMADHPQPVALSASTEITPRPNPSPRRFVAAYDVISMVPSIPIHRLVGRPSVPDTWSAQQRAHFLTHPDDPRYGALAEEIAQEVDLRFSGDDIVKALAIKDYLEREGFYTRKERHAGVEDPAASFLFGSLKGYCVHFAHAAVHLLRSQGIAARVAVGYAVDNRMRGSGSAVIIMGDRAHAWPEIHVAGVGWITFDIYPQQSDEPPPQVVAQSLESLLGEIARDDPTGGRAADPNQSAFAIPWATIGSWMAILLGFILGLAYLVKLSRWSLPLLRPGSHRLAFVAVLDGMSNVGQERRFGEARESHADRVRWLCPSFEADPCSPELTLGYTVKAIGIKSGNFTSGTPRNESEFTLHAKTTGLDKPMGIVVYTMSEMNTLDVDLDSFLESKMVKSSDRSPNFKSGRGARRRRKMRARIRYDVMGRDDVIELVLVSLFSGGHVLLEDYPGRVKQRWLRRLGNRF